MTKHIADHVARGELVADFHDQVPIALRFIDRPLSCVDQGLDVTLVDRHSPARGEKVLLEIDEQQCPTSVIGCIRHATSMAPASG
jgi:hypothetical protein